MASYHEQVHCFSARRLLTLRAIRRDAVTIDLLTPILNLFHFTLSRLQILAPLIMLTLEAFLQMVDNGHKTMCSLGKLCHWCRFPDFGHFYHARCLTVPANSDPFPLKGVDTPLSNWTKLQKILASASVSTPVHNPRLYHSV